MSIDEQLADDHWDRPEKIDYYTRFPEETQEIIANAQRHVARFQNERIERITALLVMQKYIDLSHQPAGQSIALQPGLPRGSRIQVRALYGATRARISGASDSGNAMITPSFEAG